MKATRIKGFTLAEVLVASTISGFVALVAVGALKTIADSAKIVNDASETTGELRFAARMLARDLANLYRDPEIENMKLVGYSQSSETEQPPSLCFYMVGRTKARPEQPEGDLYEIEYVLGNRQGDEITADVEAESMVLFRRLWPNPDREATPGGILAPIAENISGFQIRFYDGEQWGPEWSEQLQAMPQLIEVTLAMQVAGRSEPLLESLMVSFPRLAEASRGSAEDGESTEEGSEGPERNDESGNERNAQGPPQNGGR